MRVQGALQAPKQRAMGAARQGRRDCSRLPGSPERAPGASGAGTLDAGAAGTADETGGSAGTGSGGAAGAGAAPSGGATGGGSDTGGASAGGSGGIGPGGAAGAGAAEECPNGCWIAGVCYAADAPNDDNDCLACAPASSTTGWTILDGVSCDDGDFCNGRDSCSAGSCSVHEGNPCGDDACRAEFAVCCPEGSTGADCATCLETNDGVEICDGLDNDRSGSIDDGFVLSSDASHCGGCGNDCSAQGSLWPSFGDAVPEHVAAFECVSATCAIAECVPGFADDSTSSARDCSIGVREFASGDSHTCALMTDTTVRCWGEGVTGTLGVDTGVDSPNYVPVSVLSDQALGTPLSGVIALSSGTGANCAVLDTRRVVCWGDNRFGQLGADTGVDFPNFAPVVVTNLNGSPLETVKAICHSGSAACALVADGTMRCWGANGGGSLGAETAQSYPNYAPVTVTNVDGTALQRIASISMGLGHTCAVGLDGTPWCWGSNQYGQLGNPAGGGSDPVEVMGLAPAQLIHAGTGGQTCGLNAEGSPFCWGNNEWGQLGAELAPGAIETATPTLVTIL